MRKILIILICFLPMFVFAQPSDSLKVISKQAKDEIILKWLVDLNEKGIELTEDSIKVSREFQKVLQDENYRAILYPKTYTWEQAVQFIQVQELKKAFWYFINLYPENDTNKELVIKSIVTYDRLFKMDEIIVNTFYTYCYLDPEVSVIKEGKPETIHPDILEKKLRAVKEMVAYVIHYRNQPSAKTKQE